MQINIGKKGLTEGIISEIKKILKKEGKVKVRFLKSALSLKNRWKLAEELAHKTNSEIEKQVGFTVLLRKYK